VESGLFKLMISRYRKRKKLILLRELNKIMGMKMSNATLFNYVLLARKYQTTKEEVATKISAFVGTFVITGFMLSVATLLFVFETGKPNYSIVISSVPNPSCN